MPAPIEYERAALSNDRQAVKLRELASWYREFAERAGNPVIWEARLCTAEDLEQEAERIEQAAGSLPCSRSLQKEDTP